jgi:carbamoyl-phosphate synthase large subunit
MKPITVLITGAGAPGAPGIIKSLRLVKERKIKIIGVDMDKNAIGFTMVDKYYLIPPAKDRNFIKKVKRMAKKEKVDVIIPLVTRELFKFAQNKKAFEKEKIKVSVSDLENLKIANNKYLLMKHCRENKIPTPTFRLVKNYKEFERAVFDFGYPKNNVCFKPPVSNGLRGFRILTKKIDRLDLLINYKPTNVLTTLEEIRPVLKNAKPFPELIVMEYLPGDEYSVDVLATNGKTIIIIPRSRDKLKMGISFVGTTVNDKEIIKYSTKIIETLKLNGNIGLQFKEDKRGIPKIIESNPRVQGTIVLCTAAGANLVYLAVKLALGERITKPKIKWSTKIIRYWEEAYYDKRGYAFTL